MCKVTEDCYDLISHWNLRDSFKSSLEMVCTSEGFCKSTNRQLWTRGTITGEEFCHQRLEMKNIFDSFDKTSRDMYIDRWYITSYFPVLIYHIQDVSPAQLQENVMDSGTSILNLCLSELNWIEPLL